MTDMIPVITGVELENALIASAALDIYLSGVEDGCFSNQRQVAQDKLVLGNLFRDYLKSKLPQGSRVIKQANVWVYEITGPGQSRYPGNEINNMTSQSAALALSHDSLEVQDLNTIGLWLLEHEFLESMASLQLHGGTSLPGVVRSSPRYSRFEVNMETLLLSGESVLHPTVAINAIAQERSATFRALEIFRRYQLLKNQFDVLDAQRREQERREQEQAPQPTGTNAYDYWMDGDQFIQPDDRPAERERELTTEERAMLTLQRAAEQERRRQGVG